MKFFLILFFSIQLFANPRVIALSPSINEIIFALGKGDTIVANTQFSNYPKQAQNIPKVGGYFSVNLEKVVALKPDMVFLESFDKQLVQNLKQLNIKHTILKTNSMADILNAIEKIAHFYNETTASKEILHNIQSQLSSIENIIHHQKVLMVISASTHFSKPIYVVGHNVYLEDIILRSNNLNAYDMPTLTQPTINLETIIKLNPDIIILLAPYLHKSTVNKQQLIAKWKTIPVSASFKNSIYVIDKEYAGIPSQRVQHFIQDYKKALQDVANK